MTLEAFAKICHMSGERLIACDMLSIFNDRWFGQWLALRKPFRLLEELLDAEVVEKACFGLWETLTCVPGGFNSGT